METAEHTFPALAAGVETKDFGGYAIVAAPAGRAHLRLEADELALLSSLDGSHSLSSLREVGGPTLDELLDDLREGGFLRGAPAPAPGRATLTAQGVEFDGADRLMQAVYRVAGRHAFTRTAAAVLVTLIVFGFALLAQDMTARRTFVLAGVSPVVALVVLRVLGLTAVALHESGHAMVIVRHRRRVGRAGIGFYWGLLSFYVDASDALFLDRRARMLQAAAGCITDLAVGSVALILARLVPGVIAPEALREVAVLGYLSVLLQVVPLLELDGYWFLADALDRPMLRQDSTHALGELVARRPADRRLAAYAAASVAFGVVCVVMSATFWWKLFGGLFHQLWAGGIGYKALAAYLVLPFILMALQAAARFVRMLGARRRS